MPLSFAMAIEKTDAKDDAMTIEDRWWVSLFLIIFIFGDGLLLAVVVCNGD